MASQLWIWYSWVLFPTHPSSTLSGWGQQLESLSKDLPPPSQASLRPTSQGVGQPRQRRHVAAAGKGCGSGPSSINPLGIWFLSTTPTTLGAP